MSRLPLVIPQSCQSRLQPGTTPRTLPQLKRRATTIGPRRASAGFTLIEALIAIALTGLVLASVAEGIRLALRARTEQTHALARRDELDSVERTLRSLLERADPGGVSGRPPLFAGEARTLSFTSTLPVAAAGQITRLVDVTLTDDAAHRLVLSWVPHLPNLIPATAAQQQDVLLEATELVEFGYWKGGSGTAGGTWLVRWAGPGLPPLIRIRIALASGVHFPDIIIRPERDRWRP